MKRPIKKYDVTQCALYKCANQRRLEKILRLQKYDLNYIASAIEYHSFQRDKKGTLEKRIITAPGWTIKQIQARILKLLQPIERPDWLISGEKGKCYIQNGEAHRDSHFVLAVDIRKFYDNCSREYVYRFFVDYLKTSNDVAGVLTDIVTYNSAIPTGCPTSQIIAYYAYRNMFHEIYEVAYRFGCTFTLYVDDMTFSSQMDFPHERLANEIDKLLRKYGHKPKYRKTKYYGANEAKPITGTIVTPEHTLDIPNSLQRKVYDNFQYIKNAVTNHQELGDEDTRILSTLRGQIQAARNIDRERFPEIKRITNSLPAHTSVDTRCASLSRKHPSVIRIRR